MELISARAYSAISLTLLKDSCPLNARFLLEISRLESRRYEALVVWVRLMIWATYSQLTVLFTNKSELCVRLPPDLCMDTDAISAPASIAETGRLFSK